MNQLPDYLNTAIGIINKCSDALNNKNHKLADKLLVHFDKVVNNKNIPLIILFKRLTLAVELYSRTGFIAKSLAEIEKYIEVFDKSPDLKFSLLLQAGLMEASTAHNKISIKYLSEALGLAESLENDRMIADVYAAIAHMFSPKYEGLAFYFYRHAELFYEKAQDNHNLAIVRMRRAMLSFSVSRNFPDMNRVDLLRQEAEMLVSKVDETDLDPFEQMYAKYVKGIILRDEHLLEELLEENAEVDMLPDKGRYREMLIGIYIEKGLFDKAACLFDDFEKDERRLRGDDQEIDAYFAYAQEHIKQRIQSVYVPYRMRKRPDEPTNLFDILSHYSLCDELWALDKSEMRLVFPTYRQEGLFETVTMPDGRVVLYPCAIAFNVFYRGQAEFFEEAKPSLYRAGMSEAKQFVERVRYEELKRCIESSPLVDIFQRGIFYTYPDGRQECLSLSVDALALAQHYGIKTELMDLTTDKFVAAFFATTDKDKTYIPITDNRKKQGVFYRYSDTPGAGIFSPLKLRAVGLQPFSRPGEQKGLVYEMKPDENFNNAVISKDFFTHDPEISSFIFNYMNRSQKLFPKSSLESHADAILKSEELSREAFDAAKREFYPETSDDILASYLSEEGITIVEGKDFSFSDEEKQQFWASWERDKDKILSKIIVRLSYMS